MFLGRDEQEESYSENDFEELDKEIGKAIRGESPLNEEKTENKITDISQFPHLSQKANEFKNKKNGNSKDLEQNIDYQINKINQKNNFINQSNNLDSLDKKNKNLNLEKNFQNLNQYSNIIFSPSINIVKTQFNNINLNFINFTNNNSFENHIQKPNYYLYNKPMAIENKNENLNYSSFESNFNNNKLFFLPKNINNNFNQTNNINSNEYINNDQIANDLLFKNNYNSNHINDNNLKINDFYKNFNQSLPSVSNQTIDKSNFLFLDNQISSFNNINEINNNNNKNYFNINLPMNYIVSNSLFLNNNNQFNQNYFSNNQNNGLNDIELNNFNNNYSNNINNNLNIDLQKNENEGNIINDNKKKEKLIKTKSKKEKHKKNKKNFSNLYIKDKFNNINELNGENIISKELDKDQSNQLNKNGKINKSKKFNPIPDSEKAKNIINLSNILQYKDPRTTLMIKNIPNKYTINSFLEEIDENFKGTYDIFYLPIDYVNKCNLGFAFINFIEPLHIILFYELYRGKKWRKFNSKKKCELLYAKFQGRKELISHFERGKILFLDSEEKKPLILPVPSFYPKIKFPFSYLSIFTKLYPYISYEIFDRTIPENKDDFNYLKSFFSIKGKFSHN